MVTSGRLLCRLELLKESLQDCWINILQTECTSWHWSTDVVTINFAIINERVEIYWWGGGWGRRGRWWVLWESSWSWCRSCCCPPSVLFPTELHRQTNYTSHVIKLNQFGLIHAVWHHRRRLFVFLSTAKDELFPVPPVSSSFPSLLKYSWVWGKAPADRWFGEYWSQVCWQPFLLIFLSTNVFFCTKQALCRIITGSSQWNKEQKCSLV